MQQKAQVQTFYRVLWDAHNEAEIPRVLHEDVTFRGSLGQETRGHAGFAEYVKDVHRALADYRCVIEELLEEGNKVFAKMTFTGVHRDHFLGYAPSGQRLSWHGCALFTFRGDRIADIWVLGDLKGLEQQLCDNVE